MELGLEVAALFARGGPGTLDQGGLEPERPLAHAGGAPLAGALVILGTQTGPGDQVPLGREAAHVTADLGEDDAGAQIADTGNGVQQLDGGAKGFDIGVDLPIDLADGAVDGVDLL